MKNRFARYSGSSRGLAAPKARRSRFFLMALVLVIGAMFWMRWPFIPARFLARFASTPFPETGAVRWFIPVAVNGVGDVAPLTITGLAEAGQYGVVPLGRYRISYAPNASWQGELKLQGETQGGVDGATGDGAQTGNYGTVLI